ncbi:hypothetical protein CAPTEDRAFT_117146, partial [Capitella teleta]
MNSSSDKFRAHSRPASRGEGAPSQAGARIAKVMARAGLCSRREAERWIADGRVAVNGEVLDSPACVVTDKDKVIVDGKQLGNAGAAKLWLYHKPPGLVTTHADPEGRPTVFQHLPASLGRVISIGRLDLNSEGLLLLTNAGTLAHLIEHPSLGWTRAYRVRAYGHLSQSAIDRLAKGVVFE